MQLGQILLKKKLIAPSQLDQAINQQSLCGQKLGELLLKEGFIVNEQLEQALKEQYWRKNGFWVID